MSRRPRNKRPEPVKPKVPRGSGQASRDGSVPRKRGPHAGRIDAGRPRSASSTGKPRQGEQRHSPKRRSPARPDPHADHAAPTRSTHHRPKHERKGVERPHPEHDRAARDRSAPDRVEESFQSRRMAPHERAARERASGPDSERPNRPPPPSFAEETFLDEAPFTPEAHGYYFDDPLSSDETELGIGTRVVPPGMNLAFDADDDALDTFDTSAFGDARPSSDSEMEATIQALEARLDGLIRQASEYAPSSANDPAESARPDALAREAARDQASPVAQADEDDQSAVEATRELLSSEYYRRQWGRVGLRRRAEHIDDFGHDPVYERKLAPVLDFLFKRYFRCETQGVDNIPAEGRCLIVANHSGTLPLDGVMLRRAVRLRHAAKRELRWLAEDFIFYLPFLGVMMNRLGAVRACQENAQRLLMEESLVVAFPEGTKGVKKLFRQRYQLQRFGRGGYIRLCLRTGTPIVPCAIIGAEETNPLLFRFEQLPRLLGWPYLPVTPTFPLLGPLGLLPAPTKWKIIFGEPLDFDQYGPADANDHVLVGRLSEQVQAAIRDMLARGLAERNGVWLG